MVSVTSGLEFTQSKHAKLPKAVKVSGKYHEHHVENKNVLRPPGLKTLGNPFMTFFVKVMRKTFLEGFMFQIKMGM